MDRAICSSSILPMFDSAETNRQYNRQSFRPTFGLSSFLHRFVLVPLGHLQGTLVDIMLLPSRFTERSETGSRCR